MAKKSRHIPAYVHHKATGQARVRIKGKDHYLGTYGSPESHDRYDELISELVIDADPASNQTLTAVLAAFWAECKRRYSKGKGKLGGAQCWRSLIRLLRTHHGQERAEDLGPVKLRKLLENATEEFDWSNRYAKMQLGRVKLIYKWAAAEELVSFNAYQRLTVLQIRSDVGRKTAPPPPVPDSVIVQTLPPLKPVVADMVRFQRLTGMRPGELVLMKRDGIDRSDDVWVYTPETHKNQHRGKSRTIYIGPKAQQILGPWLLKAEGEYVWCYKADKPYSSDSYRRAVHRRIDEENERRQKGDSNAELIERWSPNQIRKAAATSIRAALDVEAAASILGHSSSVVTQDHYASANRERGIEAAKLLG